MKSPAYTGNRALAEAMQQLRRSNAATPIPSGKRYTRKIKHAKREVTS